MGAHPGDDRVEGWRAELPATARVAFLNTGTFGPLCRAGGDAMAAVQAAEVEDGRLIGNFGAVLERIVSLRARLGVLFGAPADRVALTRSTTEAMNAALWGWPLEEGDEVVTTTAEHPGLLVPLNGLVQRLGVALRVVDVGTGSGDLLDALLSACGERTRLIAVSHVLWTTGAVLPVAELAAAARERGIGLLLDGAQAAGQIPVDVDAIGADAYALPGQKWLCGPDGTGALLLGEDALSTIEPTYGGYFSQEATDSELGMVTLHPDARRYEVAIPTPAHAAGLEAAVAFLADDVGLAAAGRRGRSLAAELRERLAAAGGTVVSPEGDRATGLVTVVADDPAAAEVACRTAGVEIRSLPGLPWVRASVGAWNTVQDLDRFVAAVRPQLA